MQAPDTHGLSAVRPIFIIGAPRSGTSITGWALGQHPNIQPMPETGWIASMGVGAFLSWRKGSERGKYSHLSNVQHPLEPFLARTGAAVDAIVKDVFDARCRQFYGEFRETGALRMRGGRPNHPLQLMRSIDDPKQRWIDGTPLNTQFTWILAAMFPHARFIHNLRRPDEVATSLEGFDTVGADPQPLAQGLGTWIEHTGNAWYAERAFGAERVFRLDFARLSGDPAALFGDLLRFLGEPDSPDCLLPLGKRLNSSEVDAHREQNLRALRDMPAFQTAEALYAQVVASPVPADPEAGASDILRQRFLDYCHDRSLV